MRVESSIVQILILLCMKSLERFRTTIKGCYIKNDPSAGSPTDTVLRLLHPLDDKAHDASPRRATQSISNYKGPCNLPDHPIG